MKEVLVLVFDGVEEVELFAVIDILKRAGISVVLISAKNSEYVTSRSGFRIDYDCYAKFGYLCLEDYDALYVPGGAIDSEFKQLFNEYGDSIIEQVRDAYNKGCILAADCVAPALLASYGVFDIQPDYQITCYLGTEKKRIEPEHLAKKLSGEHIHVDRQIITGNGPVAATELAVELASALVGAEVTKKVLQDMGYAN